MCVQDPIIYGCPVRGARRPRRACRRVPPAPPTGGAADPAPPHIHLPPPLTPLSHPPGSRGRTAGGGITGDLGLLRHPSLPHTGNTSALTGEYVLLTPLSWRGATRGPRTSRGPSEAPRGVVDFSLQMHNICIFSVTC